MGAESDAWARLGTWQRPTEHPARRHLKHLAHPARHAPSTQHPAPSTRHPSQWHTCCLINSVVRSGYRDAHERAPLRRMRDASSSLSGKQRLAASCVRAVAGTARPAEAGSLLRRGRPRFRPESARTLPVPVRGHTRREPRLQGPRRPRHGMGRQARRRSAGRGCRVAAFMGNRLPPAGGLLRAARMEGVGRARLARGRGRPAERRAIQARSGPIGTTPASGPGTRTRSWPRARSKDWSSRT